LARTPTVVVSSGVKSLLDVPATHEALESLGVPVLGWRTDSLPLFYSRDGGPSVERIDTAEQVARLSAAHWSLGGQALLVARPPDPELPADEMTRFFDAALVEAEREGVVGGAVTPFVLAHAHEASHGLTRDVNHQLIVDNAALAASISVALENNKTGEGSA
ncbi:MAG: pseudouridine-5'-phosphate glycosidase, partial [Gaiellaceae bacterium]